MWFSALVDPFFAPNWALIKSTVVALLFAACAIANIRLHAKPLWWVVLSEWTFAGLLAVAWLKPEPKVTAWAVPAVIAGLAALAGTVYRPSNEVGRSLPRLPTRPPSGPGRLPRLPQLPTR